MLNVIVSCLDPDLPRYVIEAVDPVRGIPSADGTVRTPILRFGQASRFYPSKI